MNGTKRYTEIVGPALLRGGRKAFQPRRRCAAKRAGVVGSEYPGLSNDKCGQNPHRRKDKVSWVKFVFPGLVES